jgi:hypothetical protein
MMLDIWFASGMKSKEGKWIPGVYGEQSTVAWDELVQVFAKPEKITFTPSPDDPLKAWQKGNECWIPALLKTDLETGKPLTRSAKAIQHYSCVVLDIDEGCDAAAVEAALRERDLSFIIHSTYSHNPEQDRYDRVRVVVPLNRPVEGHEQYKAVVRSVALLAGGGKLPAGFDDASGSTSQAWWLPACPPEREHQYLFQTHTSKAYEWDFWDLLDGTSEQEAPLPNPGDEVPPRQPITMQMLMPQVLEGGRNNALFRVLCQWLREQPKLPPAGDVVAAGIAMMQDRHTFPKPLPNNEIRQVAHSALNVIRKETPEKIDLPDVIDLSKLKPQPIRWLIDQQLVLGELTVIQGHTKSGKSLLCMHWAAELSRQGIKTLISHSEDSPERTLNPRQHVAGAVQGYVLLIPDEALMELPEGITILRQYIIKHDAKLIYIDAINNWMPSKGVENDRFLRSCLQPLAKLAQELNVAIVASRHFTKDGNNTDALARGMGGQAYSAVARQILQVVGGVDKHHPDYPNDVLLSVVTGQHISKATTWAFPRTAAELEMEDEAGTVRSWIPYLKPAVEVPDLTASDILKAISPLHQTNSRKGNCAAAILSELEAAGGRMLTSILRETMIATHQTPPATYERALKGLVLEGKILTGRGRNQEVSLVI